MSSELKAQDKEEISREGEGTRPGKMFSPAVDISESEDGMTLVADMPGVTRENLSIDLKEDVLTIRGRVDEEQDEQKVVYREFEFGDFFRQFTLSEAIDQQGITASLTDGVLTLFLPKAQPARPRKIEIHAD